MNLPIVFQKVERRLARFFERRPASLVYAGGYVCFTFDDLWRSACIQGAAILQKHAVKGTFYFSGKLTGTANYHTEADLLRLACSGHELGCHGFGHLRYQSLSKVAMLVDLQNNRCFFEKLGLAAPKSFAYPFGHVSPLAKRIVASKFVSMRGVQPGINRRVTDLALLKAFPLYQHLWTEAKLTSVLAENAKDRGLLIFFTHGVRPDPGKFDCSIELLNFAVRTSIAMGNAVGPVRDAVTRGLSSARS